MTDSISWFSNSPCCCALSLNTASGATWEADIEFGYANITTIEFLGVNHAGYYGQEISVHTSSGWESCGTTSSSNMGVW